MSIKSILLTFPLGLILLLGSCSSEKYEPEPPVEIEDSSTARLRELCERFGLNQERIFSLNSLLTFSQDNVIVLSGFNENYEVSLIICDINENKTIYQDYASLRIDYTHNFSMPYGENKTLPLNAVQVRGMVHNGSNLAILLSILYGEPGSVSNFAFIHYHLLYSNGRMQVIQRPVSFESQTRVESLLPWSNNSVIFYYPMDYDNPQYKAVTCYDKSGNLCFEVPYPLYRQQNTDIDIFHADLTYPYNLYECLSISHYNGFLTISAANLMESRLLWCRTGVEIESYQYRNNDRITISYKSFNNNELLFTVNVLSYDGTSQNFDILVNVNGDVTFL